MPIGIVNVGMDGLNLTTMFTQYSWEGEILRMISTIGGKTDLLGKIIAVWSRVF